MNKTIEKTNKQKAKKESINNSFNKNKYNNHSKYNRLNKLTINDIEKFYTSYRKENLIGLEYERLSLDKNTLNCANYSVVSRIIEIFAKEHSWKIIYDNETIIGAIAQDNTSISLEPGCQLEISLAPKKNIIDIDLAINKIINSLDNIAQKNNVIFLGYGINPKNSIEKIPLLNKQRYSIMDNYLPSCKKALKVKYMMRKTAGIQVNVDYFNEQDAYYKLKFYNLIMPFLSALCSNSPIENDVLTNKKSIRANVWRFVGSDRCNIFYKKIFKNNFLNFAKPKLFRKYIEEIFKVPMIYIERGNKNVVLNGKINFKEFLKKGYKDTKARNSQYTLENSQYDAQYEDYILHQSLCFPDVRLKKYIEIRNHDSSSAQIALALCAFYKGLNSLDFKQLLKKFGYLKINNIEKYNIYSINRGINYRIKTFRKRIEVVDILRELINISKNNLSSLDRIYLEPLIEMVESRKTNSDIIIDYNINNTKELVEFLNNSQ